MWRMPRDGRGCGKKPEGTYALKSGIEMVTLSQRATRVAGEGQALVARLLGSLEDEPKKAPCERLPAAEGDDLLTRVRSQQGLLGGDRRHESVRLTTVSGERCREPLAFGLDETRPSDWIRTRQCDIAQREGI